MRATEEDDAQGTQLGVILLDAKAQETKKTPFLNCVVQVPTGLRQTKTLPTPLDLFPGLSFSQKGAEPQTVKQCALHAVAASLVRESGAIHGARANAGFHVPLDPVCFYDVP